MATRFRITPGQIARVAAFCGLLRYRLVVGA